MNDIFRAAWIICRRDFVATVYSRTFVLFLLAPLIGIGFGYLIGETTGDADRDISRPKVAIVAAAETAAAMEAAHKKLSEALGERALPVIESIVPEGAGEAQARALLASSEANVSAVMTGTLDRPVIYGPADTVGNLSKEMALVAETARTGDALRAAGAAAQAPDVAIVTTPGAGGEVNMGRHALARVGQTVIFFFTIFLAGMLLSNLVEEKSNKVIEILAAAVPLDAVFLGKIMAMLAISVIGVVIWGTLGVAAVYFFQGVAGWLIPPAVGWPLFILLLLFYFAANYMLFGALFVGIGAQANSVREVQTLSMPITFGQLIFFAAASATVGQANLSWTIGGALFPLTSPLTMIALAAQSPALWPHLLAILWQLTWLFIIVRVATLMFRVTVMKSGKAGSFFGPLKAAFARKP
ncbi:ABC transporter permease [Allosphingosinicella flava]|uniref:ABC transporter permease n=1 Tax=Allosphingosinicella flava TaxID=2771430 RepID=A0A7T2GJ72_9SPHN|nr:ABC transporter permease [Sphingosinicella flava]QPQ54871.1 ABC transporter permease [Sphingosinicella flava]